MTIDLHGERQQSLFRYEPHLGGGNGCLAGVLLFQCAYQSVTRIQDVLFILLQLGIVAGLPDELLAPGNTYGCTNTDTYAAKNDTSGSCPQSHRRAKPI